MRNPHNKATAAMLPWLALVVSSWLLGACAGAPPIDAQASFQVAPELAARAPAEVAMLPVEDNAGGFAELDAPFRRRLAESLTKRRYSPLRAAWVDEQLGDQRGAGSPVDSAWVAGLGDRLDADVLFGVSVVEWDLSEIMMSRPRVRFVVQVLMLDAHDGTVLCSGRYQGSLKPGGSGAAQIGRQARTAQAAETLAENLALQIPERARTAAGEAAAAAARAAGGDI